MLFNFLQILGYPRDFLVIQVDLLIELDDLLPLALLPVHLLQVLHLYVLVHLLYFPDSLPPLIFHELYLLIIERVQLALLIVFFSDFLQLILRCFHLRVETLRPQKLIGLRLYLQILILHYLFYEELPVTYFADVTFYFLGRLVFLEILRRRHRAAPLLTFLYLYVCLVHRVSSLLIPALPAVLQSAEMALFDILRILESVAAASAILLI